MSKNRKPFRVWAFTTALLLVPAASAFAGTNNSVEEFLPIGTTSPPDTGFFSLEVYNGTLFAGTYGTPRGYTWDGAAWLDVTGALSTAGESLFDMVRFSVDGRLYGTTESEGKVFRFNEATRGWEEVFDTNNAYVNGYSITEYQGHLFTGFGNFPNNGFRVVRSRDGVNWQTVWTSGGFSMGRFIVYNGHLYVVGVRDEENLGVAYRTDNAASNSWSAAFTLDNRSLGSSPFVWNGKLYLGTEQWPYDPDGLAAIYVWDGARLQHVFTPPAGDDAQLFTGFQDFGGELYAISRTGWRTSGRAKLYKSVDGASWTLAHAFPEAEGWTLAVYGGALYAGTRDEGGGGKVYRKSGDGGDTTAPTVSITSPASGDTVSGTVNVAANASDNKGVATVEFFMDGLLKATDTSSPYTFSWDSRGRTP